MLPFPNSQDHKNSATSNGDSQTPPLSPSSPKKPCWPQSYERSMGLYSRSPSAVGWSSSGKHKDQLPQVNSDVLVHESGSVLDDVKVPLLIKDTIWKSEDVLHYSHRDLSQVKTQSEVEHDGHVLQPQRSSGFQAILNGVNMLAGVGLLSMPYAVSQGGWLGLSFLLVFACVCCYTGVLLCRCLDLDPQMRGYPDVGEAAFGKFGRFFVSGLLYLELYAVAVEFLILEGDNLTQLISWDGLNFGMFRLSSQQSFIILSALVMLPTVWLRDLSLLSYISAGGVIACVVVILAVAWVGVFGGIGLTTEGTLLNVKGLPIAVGLYAFCYCGHAVFPNIYGSMKERTKFSHVLLVCFIVCTCIYGGMAVLGYLMFGDSIKSQVTLNLPRGTAATEVAIIATLVNPFAKYALTVTPLAAALEELLPYSLKSWSVALWGMAIRTGLVASTVVVALTVPFFAYLMALVGSFLSIAVAIIIPCICYLKLFWGRVRVREWVLIGVFVAVGFIACVAGTYSSILEIVKSLSGE